MRVLIGLCLTLLIVTPAWATEITTTASKVFAAVSPSIVVVEALDANGHAIAQGSGVVIAKGVVVSNCHVFDEAVTQTASVIYQGKRLPAELRYGDPSHDLCSFMVKGLAAPSVQMGATAQIKVGENAYAVGAPEGLDLTLSNGIVSSLRKIPDGVVIQTTAPISPGSSGGGLFDDQGHLIGITSYYEKEGQQLNFALPVEWIKALPQRGKTLKELANQPAKPRADNQKGFNAWLSGDYTTALSILKPKAEHGDADAQTTLGRMYAAGQGVPQDYVKAAEWISKAAAQGSTEAQIQLGLMYRDGQGVPQDYVKAAEWFSKAAANGNAFAQTELGHMYWNGEGVPQDYEKALYWSRKGAAQGIDWAQIQLGVMYRDGQGVPQDYVKAAEWLSKAAANGNAFAQTTLGRMYAAGQGVPQDYVKAAEWLSKAAAQGDASAEYGLGLMYAMGIGLSQNYAQAFFLYRKAAAQGYAQAQSELGWAYFKGQGVAQDYVVAYALFNISASLDSSPDNNATGNRNAIMKVMTPAQVEAGQVLTREMQRVGVLKALDTYLNSASQ